MDKLPQTAEDYLALPYTEWVRVDLDDGGFVAGVEEWPGCLADGETRTEALEELQNAKRAWVESALAFGDPVPLPLELEGYSGRILLRTPRSLHRDLAKRATREGVSLNQLCVSYLSRALGLTATTETETRGTIRAQESCAPAKPYAYSPTFSPFESKASEIRMDSHMRMLEEAQEHLRETGTDAKDRGTAGHEGPSKHKRSTPTG